jgi:CheY-like chemotaxis protein
VSNGVTQPESRALVADDDPTMLLLMRHVVEALGHPSDAVTNGGEAFRAWERSRHSLALLDIEMPEMDGLEVCRRIRATEPDRTTFVIIVTGRDRATDLEEVLAAGADDYVTKPTTGEHLTARLRIAKRRMSDDRARRDAEGELRRARWLAGIGETTVAIQHEINNPLAGLMATAELLKMEAEERGKPIEELRIIVEQARRIAELVKRMGDLRDPKSVPYAGDSKMIDLRDKH